MNIKDFRILTGAFNAYIARPAKKGGLMLEPRKVISEGEILNLIAWWLDQKLDGADVDNYFVTIDGEPIIELKRLKKYYDI